LPQIRPTKSTIDTLPTPEKEIVFWDQTLPGFGLKITPKGRKVFIVLYRGAGGGSRLRKYTIGPYGRITLHNARIEAQKVLAARLEGPASEKLDARRRLTADTVPELIGLYGKLHLSQRRSGREVMQILQRDLVERVGSRSVHSISKRDVIDVVNAVIDRGSPVAANKSLKVVKSFFNWCVGRAIVERSPCVGIRAPTVERARDRVLTDRELAAIIRAARQRGGPYGAIVEILARTGQRRDEVARMSWDEVDLDHRVWTLPAARTKNEKPHVVQLSDPAAAVIGAQPRSGRFVFSRNGTTPVGDFSSQKRRLDELCRVSHWRLHDLRRTTVSGMASLGVAPHVADKILNHVAGTISGVAAVYQRHEFLKERRDALEYWGAHVEALLREGEVIELRTASWAINRVLTPV
jgi:integrase